MSCLAQVPHSTWDVVLYFLKLIPANNPTFGNAQRGLTFALSDGEDKYAQASTPDGACTLTYSDGSEERATLDSHAGTISVGGEDNVIYEVRTLQSAPRCGSLTHARVLCSQATPYIAFQCMIRAKDFLTWKHIHGLRDQLMQTESGRAAANIASFGSVEQHLSPGARGLLDELPFEAASYIQPLLDSEVYPRLMSIHAGVIMTSFVTLIKTACPPDDVRFWLQVGPVKKPERIAVKVCEYKAESEKDASEWPFIRKVGDVLRLTIICADGDALLLAVQRIIKVFDVREGNGRLKNYLGTTRLTPPRVLINCVVRVEGCPPMMAEIQVHLKSIKIEADLQHIYYTIKRAASLEELVAEHDKAGRGKEDKQSTFRTALPVRTSFGADVDVPGAPNDNGNGEDHSGCFNDLVTCGVLDKISLEICS